MRVVLSRAEEVGGMNDRVKCDCLVHLEIGWTDEWDGRVVG